MTRRARFTVTAAAAAAVVMTGCGTGAGAGSVPRAHPISSPVGGMPGSGGMLPGGGTVTPRPGSSVPLEFRSACGHPGAHVVVRRVPITIRHADCDLTGVTVSYKRHGGAVVGEQPGGVGSSGGFSMVIHRHTLDVTVDSRKGPAGNA